MMSSKTPEQLDREEIERQTLERAAKVLEIKDGNTVYRQAWKIAARVIRGLKPL